MHPNRRTNQFLPLIATVGFIVCASGCHSKPTDMELIRTGINQHLASLNTLNLSAMDMDVNSVSIEGNQARAQVTFRPKNGAPGGAGMQVAYRLEKRDAAWVVVKTEGMGGMIEHPDPGANPHTQTGQDVHGNLPNFRDVLTPSAAASNKALPPGHPPIGPGTTQTSDAPAKP